MNEFINSLNITDVSSENIKLKSLHVGSESASGQCDCHCCDGCDGPDTISPEMA